MVSLIFLLKQRGWIRKDVKKMCRWHIFSPWICRNF
jgi:hypothetical protein